MRSLVKGGVAGGGAPPGSGGGPALDPGELCGSSNPSKPTEESEEEDPQYSMEYRAARAFAAEVKANPTGSQHIGSSYGGVYLDDEVWELRMHFHDRDNIERSMMMSDITFYNLVALIETEGYGFKDYMYYVRDPGLGIEGMEEIDDDDKLEEILDNIALKNEKILNVTVVRASSPNAATINTSSNVIEQQIPLEEIGEPKLYQVDEGGVLFSAGNVLLGWPYMTTSGTCWVCVHIFCLAKVGLSSGSVWCRLLPDGDLSGLSSALHQQLSDHYFYKLLGLNKVAPATERP